MEKKGERKNPVASRELWIWGRRDTENFTKESGEKEYDGKT